MEVRSELSDDAVLTEIGGRLRRTRLESNISQQRLAAEAGVSRWTINRIEDGGSIQLTSLLRVLRALGLLEGFEALVPEPAPSPIDALRRKGRTRMRASERGAESDPSRADVWRWGDGRARESS